MALSFDEDIRPLFRDKDVKVMLKISNLDLASYETVKEKAEGIYERLADGSMPCDGEWSQEQLQTFKTWMDEGRAP